MWYKCMYIQQYFTELNNNDKLKLNKYKPLNTSTHLNKSKYRIAGKFGRDLNLAVWRSVLQPPN